MLFQRLLLVALLNQIDFPRAARQEFGMNARLITPVLALLCMLPIAAETGQTVGNLEVSEGPTPFIRFAHTTVSDVAGFNSAQFQIWPKRDRPRDRSRFAMRDLI